MHFSRVLAVMVALSLVISTKGFRLKRQRTKVLDAGAQDPEPLYPATIQTLSSDDCTPFTKQDPDTFAKREQYDKWMVDDMALYFANTPRNPFALAIDIAGHDFAVVHAVHLESRLAANFVFEIPMQVGCFGSQSAQNTSHTEGYVGNSVPQGTYSETRLARVLRYDDLTAVPELSGKGYKKDNADRYQVRKEQLSSLPALKACVANNTCSMISLSDVIAMSKEVLRGKHFDFLKGGPIFAWQELSTWKEAWKDVRLWAIRTLSFGSDVVDHELYGYDVPGEEFEAGNDINCVGFAKLLFHSMDTLVQYKLIAGEGDLCSHPAYALDCACAAGQAMERESARHQWTGYVCKCEAGSSLHGENEACSGRKFNPTTVKGKGCYCAAG